MKVKIGERIRDLRRERACTQEQLAKAIGISAQAVSRWEAMTGYPDIEYIPAIADYFGITIDELFGYTDTRAAEREKRIRELENAAKAWTTPKNTPRLRTAVTTATPRRLFPRSYKAQAGG